MAGLLEYTKNGQVTEPPLYRFMRGNVQSFLNSIPDPSKMTPEQQLAMGLNANPIMGLLGTTAYHGSPYLFDKFNPTKVGTGTGLQEYGYGTYFAENPKVADYYKFQLKPSEEYLQKVSKGEYNDLSNLVTEGNLYKVDIPDEYIPKMLDWDKPLSSQNKEIQPAINQALDKIKKLGGEVDKKNMTGRDLYFGYQQYRGNNPDFASEGLKDMGIYGVRYLDEGSRGTGQGTRNFVVFDPTDIKILERNNKGLLK